MSGKSSLLLVSLLFTVLSNYCADGRIHNLRLQNDNRHKMTLSSFGFLKGGTLAVNVSLFTYKTTSEKAINNKIFGFTLDKSNSPGLSSYVESMTPCIWNKPEDTLTSVFFMFDLKNKRVNIMRKGDSLKNLKVTSTPREQYLFDNYLEHGVNLAGLTKDQSTSKQSGQDGKGKTPAPSTVKPKGTDQSVAKSRKVREAVTDAPKTTPKKAPKTPDLDTDGSKPATAAPTAKPAVTAKPTKKPTQTDLPLPVMPAGLMKAGKPSDLVSSVNMTVTTKDSMEVYHTYFLVHVREDEEEGLYNLFFHNCLNIDSLINLTLRIIEDNNGNYLSAGEMPVPVLYFAFHVAFFVLTCVWFSVLRKAEEGVYKLHYLMLTVVFVKSVSCLFHGVNMYMIQKNGIHVDAWAILWYIVYLARGALMFVTVLLIGAGWAFIKHVFSDREKKLFLVVLPLQILANVAWVIVKESEEGTSSHAMWNRIFMVVDLLCCFAILFPVIWSIRHLQEASRTDGKAALNLNKLKLFRFFYIQVVCYIYFTRIIIYLLKITLPFHYGWIRNLLDEMFLLCFFTVTGYKFRPTSDNPYLQVPIDSDDEEDIEMEEVLTKTGNMESLTRVNQGRAADEEEIVTSGSGATTLKQRESSHEFD